MDYVLFQDHHHISLFTGNSQYKSMSSQESLATSGSSLDTLSLLTEDDGLWAVPPRGLSEQWSHAEDEDSSEDEDGSASGERTPRTFADLDLSSDPIDDDMDSENDHSGVTTPRPTGLQTSLQRAYFEILCLLKRLGDVDDQGKHVITVKKEVIVARAETYCITLCDQLNKMEVCIEILDPLFQE